MFEGPSAEARERERESAVHCRGLRLLCPLALPLLLSASAAGAVEADALVRLEGRVVDARTSRPVSGASVRLEPDGPAATSDGEGRFVLELPAAPET